MAQTKDNVYSNSDSNRNRKLDQFMAFNAKALFLVFLTALSVVFVYHYYYVWERPQLYYATEGTPAPAPVKHLAYKNNDSHPYDAELSPYEQ